jgi:hypothetical protein
MAVCGRNMTSEEGAIGVVALLVELYCVSRYINAAGCLNTILQHSYCVCHFQDNARARRQGAIIESMHHHGKGVYSGTFSGMVATGLGELYSDIL